MYLLVNFCTEIVVLRDTWDFFFSSVWYQKDILYAELSINEGLLHSQEGLHGMEFCGSRFFCTFWKWCGVLDWFVACIRWIWKIVLFFLLLLFGFYYCIFSKDMEFLLDLVFWICWIWNYLIVLQVIFCIYR